MNKKLIILALALSGTFALKAQTQKGKQLIGGNFAINTSKGTFKNSIPTNNPAYNVSYTSKSNLFGIGPAYSYFVANGLDLGVSASYTKNASTYVYLNSFQPPQTADYDSKGFSVGAYLRKYFLYAEKVGVRTGPFVQYDYAKQNMTYTPDNLNNQVQKSNSIGGGLGLDLVFFPSKKLGFASTIGRLAYTHNQTDLISGATNTDSFTLSGFSSGLTLSAFYCF
jgi:hypothetical protein